MAEDPNPLGREIAARAWPVFENQVPTNIGINYNLHGQPIGHLVHPVALVGAAGAADAAGQLAARDGLLDAAEALDSHGNASTYYGAAWVALGRIMLTTRLLTAPERIRRAGSTMASRHARIATALRRWRSAPRP